MAKKAKAKTAGKKRVRSVFSLARCSAEHAKELGVEIPKDTEERFISPNDAAKILNLTGEAVKQWIYHSRLPAIKLANGYWKIRVTDFQAFLKQRTEGVKRKVLLFTADASLTVPVSDCGLDAVIPNGYVDAMLKATNSPPCLMVIDLRSNEGWKTAEKVRASKLLRSCPMLLVGEDLSDKEAEKAMDLKAAGIIGPGDKALYAAEIKRLLN